MKHNLFAENTATRHNLYKVNNALLHLEFNWSFDMQFWNCDEAVYSSSFIASLKLLKINNVLACSWKIKGYWKLKEVQ